MTETSYTAWDDKLYQWPPPDGWYQAADGKWWPEGYGPPAGESTESTGAGGAAAEDAGAGDFGQGAVTNGAGSGAAAADASTSTTAEAAETTEAAETASDRSATAPDGFAAPADGHTAEAATGSERTTDADTSAAAHTSGEADTAAGAGQEAATSGFSGDGDASRGVVGRAMDGLGAATGPGGDAAAADEAGDGLLAARDRLGRTSDRFGVASEAVPSETGRAGDALSDAADRARDAASGVAQRAADARNDFTGPGLGRASATGLPDINDVLPTEELRVGASRAADVVESAEATGAPEADEGADSAPDGIAAATSETIATSYDDGRAAVDDQAAGATEAMPLDLPAPGGDRSEPAGSGFGSSVADRASEALSRAAEAEADPARSVFGIDPPPTAFDPSGEKTSELSSDDLMRLNADLAEGAGTGIGDAAAPESDSGFATLPPPGLDSPSPDIETLPPPPGPEAESPPPPSDLGTLPPPGFETPPPAGPPAGADALPPPPGSDAPASPSGFAPGDQLPPLGGAGAPPAGAGGEVLPPTPGFAEAPAPGGDAAAGSPASDETVLGSFGDFTAPAPTSFEGGSPGFGSSDSGLRSPLDGGAPPPAAPPDHGGIGGFGAPTTQLPADTKPGPFGRPLDGSEGSGMPPSGPGHDPRAALDAKSGGGMSRLLLFIGLGVVALVLIGVALYFAFGGDDGDGDAAAVQTGPGSIAEPHARTTGVEVFYPDGDVNQRWVVEVLEPVRDVTAESAQTPEGGDVFAATRIRVRNQDGADGASLGDLAFNAVTAEGEVIERSANACSVPGDDLDFGASLALGAQAEGSVCWEVPAGALGGLLLGIESDKVAGRVHIALQ